MEPTSTPLSLKFHINSRWPADTMPASIDITNQKYNLLTVVSKESSKTANGQWRWLCRCDCGKDTVVSTGNLRYGRTKSCGCLQRRKGESSPNYKHGLALKSHPEYKRYQRECFDRHRYSLEPEHKATLLDRQNGCCAICGYRFEQKVGDMKVDHDHDTGAVRGLLCDKCNRGIGMLQDNPEFLCNAAEYLSKSKHSLAR